MNRPETNPVTTTREIRGQSKDSVAWMTSGGRIGTFQEEQAAHVREDVWHDGTVHARRAWPST